MDGSSYLWPLGHEFEIPKTPPYQFPFILDFDLMLGTYTWVWIQNHGIIKYTCNGAQVNLVEPISLTLKPKIVTLKHVHFLYMASVKGRASEEELWQISSLLLESIFCLQLKQSSSDWQGMRLRGILQSKNCCTWVSKKHSQSHEALFWAPCLLHLCTTVWHFLRAGRHVYFYQMKLFLKRKSLHSRVFCFLHLCLKINECGLVSWQRLPGWSFSLESQ